MRLLIQRVKDASVTIDGKLFSEIGQGMLVLVGVGNLDTEKDIEYLANKLVKLRIFDDENGVMNKSVLENNGEILIVSQFTLLANTRKGNRPSYIEAAKPDVSVPIYEQFCKVVEEKTGKKVQTGQFGADMKVALTNDGPITIWIDSKVDTNN